MYMYALATQKNFWSTCFLFMNESNECNMQMYVSDLCLCRESTVIPQPTLFIPFHAHFIEKGCMFTTKTHQSPTLIDILELRKLRKTCYCFELAYCSFAECGHEQAGVWQPNEGHETSASASVRTTSKPVDGLPPRSLRRPLPLLVHRCNTRR